MALIDSLRYKSHICRIVKDAYAAVQGLTDAHISLLDRWKLDAFCKLHSFFCPPLDITLKMYTSLASGVQACAYSITASTITLTPPPYLTSHATHLKAILNFLLIMLWLYAHKTTCHLL